MARTKSYFSKEKFALRLCGISFRENESVVYKILSGILLPISCLYPFLAAGDLFKHDFETVAELLTYEFPIFVGVIKAATVLIKREKIIKVLNKLDADLSLKNYTSGNGDEEQLMKKCVLITTVQTTGYWICGCFAYIFAVSYTLSTRIRSSDYHDWQFPYGTFTILNVTHSPNFEISWAYQCWGTACIALQFTTIDLLMAAVLCHICFHLKILQSILRRIVENTHERMNIKENVNESGMSAMATDSCNDVEITTAERKNLHASLKLAVEYHLAIIDITNEVDESFSALLLLVFLGTLGILSFMAFTASMVPVTDVRMLRRFAELAVVSVQVLMVCFWSEQMQFEGKEVGTAAYEARFVGTDLRFQKSLILIIRRSQTPIRLTAGFFDISLSTFTWILRSTYSTYMVLRNHNAGVIKTITVLLNREKIKQLLNKVDSGLRPRNFPTGSGDEEQLMKKCVLITTVQILRSTYSAYMILRKHNLKDD